jgi:hypothetical protein
MQSEVTLHDVDLAALQLLVDFAYSGHILITEDNVQVNEKTFESFRIIFLICFQHIITLNFTYLP